MTDSSSSTLRHRNGDQILPSDGLQDVGPEVINDVMATELFPDRVRAQVVNDLGNRISMGISRYGHPLQTFNSRNAIQDLYEERLDSAHYAKQTIMENKLLGLPTDLFERIYRDSIRDVLMIREHLMTYPRNIPSATDMRAALAEVRDQ